MNKNLLHEIIYILISIIIGIITIKFIIWLLPIIIIGIFSYYVYKLIKKNKKPEKNNQPKKNIKIIDMVEEDK